MTSIGDVILGVRAQLRGFPQLSRFPDPLIDELAAPLHAMLESCASDDCDTAEVEAALGLIMLAANDLREAAAYLSSASTWAELWLEESTGLPSVPGNSQITPRNAEHRNRPDQPPRTLNPQQSKSPRTLQRRSAPASPDQPEQPRPDLLQLLGYLTASGNDPREGFRRDELTRRPPDSLPPAVSGPPIPLARTDPAEPLAARKGLEPGRTFISEEGSRFLTGADGRVEWVITTRGRKPNWNPELSQPQPDTTYLVDGRYLFVTESQGRVKHRDGILGFDPRKNKDAKDARDERKKGSQRTAGQPDRQPQDVGSHGFGRKFEGPAERVNMDALNSRINSNRISEYGHLERQWERRLTGNPPPRIRVRQWLQYPKDSKRPHTFEVEYTVTNENGTTEGPFNLEYDND